MNEVWNNAQIMDDTSQEDSADTLVKEECKCQWIKIQTGKPQAARYIEFPMPTYGTSQSEEGEETLSNCASDAMVNPWGSLNPSPEEPRGANFSPRTVDDIVRSLRLEQIRQENSGQIELNNHDSDSDKSDSTSGLQPINSLLWPKRSCGLCTNSFDRHSMPITATNKSIRRLQRKLSETTGVKLPVVQESALLQYDSKYICTFCTQLLSADMEKLLSEPLPINDSERKIEAQAGLPHVWARPLYTKRNTVTILGPEHARELLGKTAQHSKARVGRSACQRETFLHKANARVPPKISPPITRSPRAGKAKPQI